MRDRWPRRSPRASRFAAIGRSWDRESWPDCWRAARRTDGRRLRSANRRVPRTNRAFFGADGSIEPEMSVRAKVAELADAPDLGSGGETLEGSTPSFRTIRLGLDDRRGLAHGKSESHVRFVRMVP